MLSFRGMFPSATAGVRFRGGMLLCLAGLLLCVTLSAGCSTRSATAPLGGSPDGNAVCSTALSAVGIPYASGGSEPSEGFDCSGLVLWAYGRNGLAMPRTAKAQSKVGSAVDKEYLQPGDLVVFKIRRRLHTGIYTGSGRFVHSPSRGKDVREDNINSEYWQDKFVTGRRHAWL